MTFQRTYIPLGAYWTSPFCRWQGSLASSHSMTLAAQVARKFLADRKIAAESFDSLVLGITVHQKRSFFGAPWMAGMIGAEGATGPTVSQACATSARAVVTAAQEIEAGDRSCSLVVACDRTSNGPHVYYPDANGRGGQGEAEDPVWDNFNLDPHAGGAMIQTAENVAKECGISREEQDAIAVLRHEQYAAALANDRAFQKSYMIPVELMRGKKVVGVVEGDEGIQPATKASAASARTTLEGGTVTFAAQTHPADGNAGIVVTTKERAQQLSRDKAVSVQLLAYGEARVKKGFMPMATVPAARAALTRAGVKLSDCRAISSHNPFALNDAYFCREMGIAPEAMNRFGSPLVYGHPQAPTGLRAFIELVETLVKDGGGVGLFTGCAAGDSAMSLVVRVG